MTTFKRFLTLFFIVTLSAFTMHIWGTEQTASKTIAQIASANSWANSTRYTSCSLDANITASVSGGANTGKYYSASPGTWRLYANESATLTITAATGCTLQSITISFSPSDNGTLLDGSTVMTSGSAVSASGTSHSFSVSQSSGTKGKIFISGISVTYDDGEGGGGTPTLSSIAVKTAPTKLSYTEGEYFDPTGLVITRTYSDDTHSDWTYADHTSDFTFSPSLSTALTTSDASVTITYGGKSTTQAITVTSGGGGGGGTATFVWGTDPTKYTSGSTSETEGLVTFTGTKGTGSTSTRCWSDGLRMYAGSTASFSVPSGYVITQITGYSTFAYSSVTGLQTVEFTGLSAATCKSDVTVTYAPVVSYTVTASSNNLSYGTVSVSGYVITATPASGYVADGYTLNSGTATISQSGNIYSVTPSSDCNITINFRAAETYTITIIDNGGSYNETATEGVPYELPDNGLSSCDDATFLGWATGTYTDHATGTSIAPSYDAPGTEKDITAPTTFTAVYGTVAPSNNYAALKLESDLESGANYVLAAYYSSSDYAMNATMSNDRVDTEVKSLVLDEAGNAITDSYLIWRINVVNPATKAVTFYNAEINKYLVINGSNELTFADDPIVFNYTVDESGSAATWNFKSSSNAEYMLSFYTTYHQFNAYTANSTGLYLYKQKVEISNYTSKPQCCHAPVTPLAISSETTTFEGSGTATISLTGGNGKSITWSCKDEADADRTSYLSGTTGAGDKTLTLPVNAATKVYTVTVTQVDDETDPDNVICGATLTLDFTVKARFTIDFKTIDGGSESLYSSITVTDGDTYEMPSLAEDFDCGTTGKSFMGWASTNDATSVEKTAGTNVTATTGKTWYACWATSADVVLVPLYEKVTSASSLAAGDIVLICNTGATTAMAEQRDNNRGASAVTSYTEGGKDYVYFTGTDVHELTIGKDGDNFTFYDAAATAGYLYAASSSSNHMKTQTTNDNNGKWALEITSSGESTVTAQGSNTRKILRYNSSSKIFSCYASGQQAVVFYKKTTRTKSVSSGSGSITTDIDGCTSGPTIRVNNNQWITAAAGQKVKTVIDVTAKNFEEAATLSATSSNANFAISLAATDVPAGNTGLTTTLTVEYTPTESDITESTTITFTAGEVTKTITVNGRSLPDEFLLITKKTLWYALPGNMNDGPHEYAGVAVTPDDGTAPTMVSVAPSTVLYSLHSVTNDRYDAHGSCVRLAGHNDLCLWSNKATGADKVNIQNKVNVATASGDNYEWLLTTTDGIRYTIANPSHPQYGDGRRLAYGAKFGLYTEPTIFYIVTAGCTSQPQEVNVGARRIDATFTWISNTTDMHIDLYTNEAMTEGHLAATASSAPYVFTGLAETTDYWYKLTPGTDVACAVTGHFKTSGPIIDIVEWQENGVVLFIDKGDINPKIVIDGQEEHGSITGGGTATELFFAKYFEGAGDMKLLSIFNGTKESINLTNYSIFIRCRGAGDGWSSSDDATLNLSGLGSIAAGQEIIFFTRQEGTGALVDCSDDFLDDKVTNCSKASDNPRWVECDGTTFHRIKFNGNDPIMLKKNSTIIDIIGSQGAAATTKNCLTADNEKGWAGTVRNMDKGKSPSDPVFDAFYAATSNAPVTTQDSIDLLDLFGINLEDDEIPLTTARCILFRDKRVLNGDSAVYMNETTGTTFVTFTNHDEFKSEWYGRSVCMTAADRTAAGVSSDAKPTCNSYQDIANMDYNKYYIDWHNIDPGKTLDKYSSDPETKEYTIPIADMRQYACLKLRFQLVNGSDVLTEAAQQVPIVVAANADTNDPLFSELVIDKVDENDPATWVPLYPQSVERCKTCDVVVLGGITLTKGLDSDPKDVDEIANLKIYPGGKLIVPTSTEYTVSSLAFRRQEDAVASANIQGTLNIGKTNGTYLDFRIDPTNWHYFSLPYDCNVADIRFSNEEEVAVPVLGTDFLLKKYNGEKRAATQAGGCWEMVAADETLRKGIGYIFALPGDGKVKREFRFPMANDVIDEEKDGDGKDVAGIYAYGGDKTMTEVRANHRGWNLLGNPYLLPYTSDIGSPVMTGYIVEDHSTDPWDGHFKFADDARSDLRYIVEPVDNGWSEYRQVAITNYSMTPFTCYFVQVGGTDPSAEQGVHFNLAKVNRSSIVRRSRAEYEEVEDTHPVWCAVDLINSKDEKDETTLLISNDFTDDYDMMNDLVKMRGDYYQYAQITTKPVLASRNNEGEMAFNALPDASAEAGVPLNFFSAYSGSYTIAYNDKFDYDSEVKEVKLFDKTTNTWYDLMNEPYEFSTGRENNTTRFILSVRVERKKTPQIATDIENIGSSEAPRKLLINGHVYIQRGNRIYDITGKQAVLQ